MRFSPYDFLSSRDEDLLRKNVSDVELEKGTILYRPPQRVTPIYEIVKGAVRIGTYSPDGTEVCYDILKPGEFFGNLQYLNGQFSEFSKALTTVHLRAYDPTYFKGIIVNIPEISEWFNIQLVSRWCRAEDRLFAVRSLDASEKVRRITSHFQDQILDGKGNKINLMNLLTLQDIADLTGLTRQTVSKVLKDEYFSFPSQTVRMKRKCV